MLNREKGRSDSHLETGVEEKKKENQSVSVPGRAVVFVNRFILVLHRAEQPRQ